MPQSESSNWMLLLSLCLVVSDAAHTSKITSAKAANTGKRRKACL
jgi:hypothetical protein